MFDQTSLMHAMDFSLDFSDTLHLDNVLSDPQLVDWVSPISYLTCYIFQLIYQRWIKLTPSPTERHRPDNYGKARKYLQDRRITPRLSYEKIKLPVVGAAAAARWVRCRISVYDKTKKGVTADAVFFLFFFASNKGSVDRCSLLS